MQFLNTVFSAFVEHARTILFYPFFPEHRIYFLYLGTTLIIAFFIYVAHEKQTNEDKEEHSSFSRFLFPKKVWSHPSAWLDVRYFFFHQLIGHFLLLGLGVWTTTKIFGLMTGGQSISEVAAQSELSTLADISIATAYMFVALLTTDLIAYSVHVLQHKIPILWQFHKVHHSAEVMHPMSNFREHPVDNLVYVICIGAGYGVVVALAVNIFGFLPSMPSLLGVPLLMFAFNLVGYNLRHSHIWLRWPGKLSMIFPSPAHHHIHHSCHPDHIDKNFAFLFPLWDVLFKTYEVPEDNRDVKFGIGDKKSTQEMNTCLRLYYIPVRDAWRLMRKPFRGQPNPTNEAVSEHKSQD